MLTTFSALADIGVINPDDSWLHGLTGVYVSMFDPALGLPLIAYDPCDKVKKPLTAF